MALFAFGSNGSGQLGIGHEEDVSIPTRCIFEQDRMRKGMGMYASSVGGYISSMQTPYPLDSEVVRIVAGGNHTLVLLQNGAVYAAGCNVDGRCGRSPESGSSLLGFGRVVVEDLETGRVHATFKGVSATWEGSFLVVGSDGGDGDGGEKVFVFGSGGKGELGLGQGCERATVPMRIPDFPPRGTSVVSIASGMGHTVVVLSNGEVYGWGAARKGQLGDSPVGQKIVWAPAKIEGLPFYVSDAACGREFTAISGNKAAGEFAVLGATGDKWRILSDTPSAEAVNGYIKIDASWHGVYVHQSDLSLLAWGRNDRGQLPPADLQKAKEVAIGSEHGLALVDDRTVLAFGWGEHGNCGPETDAQGNVRGTCSRITLPEGEDFDIVGVGAGCATSWIIGS